MLSLAAVSPSGAPGQFPSRFAVGAACPRGESAAPGRLNRRCVPRGTKRLPSLWKGLAEDCDGAAVGAWEGVGAIEGEMGVEGFFQVLGFGCPGEQKSAGDEKG